MDGEDAPGDETRGTFPGDRDRTMTGPGRKSLITRMSCGTLRRYRGSDENSVLSSCHVCVTDEGPSVPVQDHQSGWST